MSTTLNAFLSKYSMHRDADLTALTPEQLARDLYITSHDFKDADYVLVGHADVTVTLLPRAEVVGMQVKSLQSQIEAERLESGVRLLTLQRQLNSLLAIEGAAQEVAP